MTIREDDAIGNRTLELISEFAKTLVCKYRVPPEKIMKAYAAAAVMLFMEHVADDERAAANYLRSFAAEIEEPHPPGTIN